MTWIEDLRAEMKVFMNPRSKEGKMEKDNPQGEFYSNPKAAIYLYMSRVFPISQPMTTGTGSSTTTPLNRKQLLG